MARGSLNNNSELIEVYNKLDLELSKINPGCDACGTCCHFDKYGHELYASTIEVDYILENVEIPPFDPDQRTCPFLVEGKCTIRDYRALGCRVFFCNPAYKDTSYEIYDRYYKIIKGIADRKQIEWRYAPMVELLAMQKA